MTIPANAQGILPPCDYQGQAVVIRTKGVFRTCHPRKLGRWSPVNQISRRGKRPGLAVSPRDRLLPVHRAGRFGFLFLWLSESRRRCHPFVRRGHLSCKGLILSLIGWGITCYKAICSYVGETGAVRYRVVGKPGNPPKTEFIDFNTAADLRTAQTRNYYNGIYTGTTYSFTWTDAAGKKLLNLRGNYSSKVGTPKPTSPYHFARVAENAWSRFLIARALMPNSPRMASSPFTISPQKIVIVRLRLHRVPLQRPRRPLRSRRHPHHHALRRHLHHQAPRRQVVLLQGTFFVSLWPDVQRPALFADTRAVPAAINLGQKCLTG